MKTNPLAAAARPIKLKLKLHKETLQKLTVVDLGIIAGGTSLGASQCAAGTCQPAPNDA